MQSFDHVCTSNGEKVFYLSRGLYATVSYHSGQPLYHIRRFFCPQTGETNAERFDPSYMTSVRPTRVGICLDTVGWQRLWALRPDLDKEFEALELFGSGEQKLQQRKTDPRRRQGYDGGVAPGSDIPTGSPRHAYLNSHENNRNPDMQISRAVIIRGEGPSGTPRGEGLAAIKRAYSETEVSSDPPYPKAARKV